MIKYVTSKEKIFYITLWNIGYVQAWVIYRLNGYNNDHFGSLLAKGHLSLFLVICVKQIKRQAFNLTFNDMVG